MYVQRQFERAGLRLVIYRLHIGNRRSRTLVVMYHMGRQCGTRVRPLSALMFSNKSPEPTAVGACSSAIAVHVASRHGSAFFVRRQRAFYENTHQRPDTAAHTRAAGYTRSHRSSACQKARAAFRASAPLSRSAVVARARFGCFVPSSGVHVRAVSPVVRYHSSRVSLGFDSVPRSGCQSAARCAG